MNARVYDSSFDDSLIRNKPAGTKKQKQIQFLVNVDFETSLLMNAITMIHAKRVYIQEKTSSDDCPVPPVINRRERNTHAKLRHRVKRQLLHLEDMVVRMQDQVTSHQTPALNYNCQPNRGPLTSEQQIGNIFSRTNERDPGSSPRYKTRGRRDGMYQQDIICFNCSQTWPISRNCRKPRKLDRWVRTGEVPEFAQINDQGNRLTQRTKYLNWAVRLLVGEQRRFLTYTSGVGLSVLCWIPAPKDVLLGGSWYLTTNCSKQKNDSIQHSWWYTDAAFGWTRYLLPIVCRAGTCKSSGVRGHHRVDTRHRVASPQPMRLGLR